MNYAAIREKSKQKIAAKKVELSKMSGADRSKMEAHLISEATKEVQAEEKLPLETPQEQKPKAGKAKGA